VGLSTADKRTQHLHIYADDFLCKTVMASRRLYLNKMLYQTYVNSGLTAYTGSVDVISCIVRSCRAQLAGNDWFAKPASMCGYCDAAE
jgi:hypothetical protein